jgi:endonuclease-3
VFYPGLFHFVMETGMKDADIHSVVKILREEYSRWEEPIVTRVSKARDPYLTLISTLISLRTKDDVTRAASEKLFKKADTPEKMVQLSEKEIGTAIYPAGFYRVKAGNIKRVSRILCERYGGMVPDTLDELLSLPGVGRKTANLVVTLAYGKQGICVDTHVHRIMNRLGYVQTKTPDKTEFALREKLPEEYWIEINDLLVTYGQNLCMPVSPLCSQCRLIDICGRIGVKQSR